MISADIPMTLTSTADFSLSLTDFIEYSIKNDLNIVTSKWLAHTRKITITEAKESLNSFWESIGKSKNYFATFSVLSQSETEGYLMELIDHDKLDSIGSNKISLEIYAIHAVPLRDKPVQLGMINVPIFDLPGEIEAPWINSENFPKIQSSEEFKLAAMTKESLEITEEPTNEDEAKSDDRHTVSSCAESESVDAPPPGKKMKMVKTTRSFMQNGYQMTETVNELVPCGDNDVDMEPVMEQPAAAATAAPAKAKQSSMMSFFKKK